MRYAVFVRSFLREIYSNAELAEAKAHADSYGGYVFDFWLFKRV